MFAMDFMKQKCVSLRGYESNKQYHYIVSFILYVNIYAQSTKLQMGYSVLGL